MRALLSQYGVEPIERDFFKDRFSENELRHLLSKESASTIFSWNSPSFKILTLKRDHLKEEDMLQLMLKEPRLIRRPLIHIGDRLIIGTDKNAIATAFSQTDSWLQ